MSAREYVVGVPLSITVHDDGRVTFDVDLAEISDCDEHVEGEITALVQTDIDTLSEAAGRIGNCLTVTINPNRNPA
jgi:hypothetical protein